MKEQIEKRVTVESTSWISIDLKAVNNYDDSIKQSERTFDKDANCYVSDLKFHALRDGVDDLYHGLKHFYDDCEGYLGEGYCKYCDMEND